MTARKKPAEAPAAKPEEAPARREPKFRISDDLLALARQRPEGFVENPFVVADYPPGTLPAGKSKPKMAYDEATSDTLMWARNAVASAYQEGIGFLGFPYLTELAQRAEYRRMSERMATEMTRKWIELQSVGDDKDNKSKTKAPAVRIKKITEEMKRLKVQDLFRGAAQHDGFFGRGHIFISIGGNETDAELKTSIGNGSDRRSKAKVGKGSLKRLKLVEPVWAYPANYNSSDPLQEDFYKPITWYVQGREVHHTRLLTFVGREVPDLLKPAYSFAGLSLSQMAKPYVDNWLRTRQSVADIIQAFSVFVLSTDLQTQVQAGGSELFKRIDLFTILRNNKGLLAIDKESEDLKNVSAPLGTLDTLQAQTQEHMAAVCGIPLIILLGISPAGLNASSEGEIRTFYDWIMSFQELLFTTHLKTIIDFIQLHLFGEVDDAIVFVWEPLWSLDAKGQADVQYSKAQTAEIYVNMGALDRAEVRKAVANDPDSQFTSINVDEIPEMTEEEETDIGESSNAGEEANEPSEDRKAA